MYPTMGGRKGLIISSQKQMRADSAFAGRIGGHHIKNIIVRSLEDVEAAQRLTKEQLAYMFFKGGNTVSEGTTISSSRTKPRLGPSNK